MGYTTDFEGRFDLDHSLTQEHADYLFAFSDKRRMRRNPEWARRRHDPLRSAVGLPLGREAGYFVGETGYAGQDHGPDVIDYNNPPEGQPGLWCQWVPTDDFAGVEWNGCGKFYNYVEWLEYLIEHFLAPWGYTLNGVVMWRGEVAGDIGRIVCTNNVVTTSRPRWD